MLILSHRYDDDSYTRIAFAVTFVGPTVLALALSIPRLSPREVAVYGLCATSVLAVTLAVALAMRDERSDREVMNGPGAFVWAVIVIGLANAVSLFVAATLLWLCRSALYTLRRRRPV
jgi:hypothetical protein